MARTIAQIQQSIIDAKNADSTLSGLSSTSNVSIWRLWTYIVAVAQWTLEQLFDAHEAEVNNIIATMKPHTLQWYVTKAKAYQYGQALSDGSDTYAVISDDPIIRKVTYAAATENISTKVVRIKAATGSAGSFAQLPAPVLAGLTTYMLLIRDAGVRLLVTSDPADRLVLALTIYYDALVLDAIGQRLDGTATTPVKDAIKGYLQNLPFNGLFVLAKLTDALQAVDGVLIPNITNAQATHALFIFSVIPPEGYIPDAGYLNIADADLIITYIPHEPI